jgi:hypothetical protein
MLRMDRERKPDRDGYLDFKNSIANGNDELQNRALDEFNAQREQHPGRLTTTLAHYMDMYIVEKLDEQEHGRDPEKIAREAEKKISAVHYRDIRQKAVNRINRLINVWDKDRDLSSMSFIVMYDFQLGKGIAERQKEHPDETHGQSWFQVRRDMESRYVDYRIGMKTKLDSAIDKVAHYARVNDAKALAEQYEAVRKVREQERREMDHDHER